MTRRNAQSEDVPSHNSSQNGLCGEDTHDGSLCRNLSVNSDGITPRQRSDHTNRIKKQLQYFFMNPCQKYQAKRRKPFKLSLQLVKFVLITVQLVLYGYQTQEIHHFINDNDDVMDHLLLTYKNNETKLYSRSDLYSSLNAVRKNYVTMPQVSLGNYSHINMNYNTTSCAASTEKHHIKMCVTSYKKDPINPGHYDLSSTEVTCNLLENTLLRHVDANSYFNSSIPLCNGTMYRFDFKALVRVDLHFGFHTMRMKASNLRNHQNCFKINVTIIHDNEAHTGKVDRDIDSSFEYSDCGKDMNHQENLIWSSLLLCCIACFMMVICMLSISLCARSLLRAQTLRQSFSRYYRKHYGKPLSYWDQLEFINFWHILIILSDILTIVGSFLLLQIELQKEGLISFDACSLFLGIGCLCCWIGLLRYVGYFHQYNILMLTMKLSIPHILRFMVCASVLYLGFMFCGWLVLGPYHPKFRSPYVASEALYSLINGDDMYMTYEEMGKDNMVIWGFSQVYLYSFISLFIYVVLSLFIAVIMETYDMIKDYQRSGENLPPQNAIQEFMQSGDDGNNGNTTADNFLAKDTYCCFCFYHNTDFEILTDSENEDDSCDENDTNSLLA